MNSRADALIVVLALCIVAPAASAQAQHLGFQVSSTTFQNGGTLPLSAVT